MVWVFVQKFSGPVATFVEGCALHMDDENSSVREASVIVL